MGDIIKGIITFIFAFMLGASSAADKPAADNDLQQKVQEHMDVITDESAAIVDDVMEEVRQNECVQEAEQFADDVTEIAENTKADIDAHFGDKKEEAEADTEVPGESTREVEGAEGSEEKISEDLSAAG